MENQKRSAIEKKKRALKRYKKISERISQLEERLESLSEKITSVRSPNLSGMPRGSKPISIADVISDKKELEERIERLKNKKGVLKREIIAEIDSLEDPRYCEILEAFFIDLKTMDDIADEQGYTVRHTYRLYTKCVILLAEKSL